MRLPKWLKPPQKIKGAARTEWNRLAPVLYENGTLGRGELATFKAYCTAYGRWQDAEEIVAVEGLTKETHHGNIIPHPCLGIANTAMKLCNKYAAVFRLPVKDRFKSDEDDSEGLEITE